MSDRWCDHCQMTVDVTDDHRSGRDRCNGCQRLLPGASSARQQTVTAAFADRMAAAITADEQDQADAVDPELGGPSPEYLAGYRAATARAADVVRELAIEGGA